MKNQSYPSDLTQDQMDILQPMIPLPSTGRPMKWHLIDVINAILYVV